MKQWDVKVQRWKPNDQIKFIKKIESLKKKKKAELITWFVDVHKVLSMNLKQIMSIHKQKKN